MFHVYLTNFNQEVGAYATLAEAKERAIKTGFETNIVGPEGEVYTYSPLAGFRRLV